MDEERDWLVPKEVALLKGVSVQAVTLACREGRLPSRNLNGTRLIRRADAEAWNPRRPRQKP